MEPAVIATTAILLTLVVGIVVQTAVSYVKKAKKAKKQAKDKRKRPESNKENVVPSSGSYRAPSASSFVTSSGQTKITEESHYQQIKSSVIRSESPAAPTTVVKHETTKTEKISTGDKIPSSFKLVQSSVPASISSVSKTRQQEVTEHSTYQQIHSTAVHSDQAQTSETTENQTKSNAEKLIPLCVEAFQDSVLSPISGIKKTKKEEVADYMQEAVIRSQTPPVKQNIQLSNAHKPIPVSVETFRASVGSPVSGVSRTKTEEVTQDGSKTEKTTTETIQETKGSCQTTILRKEKESVVRDSFVPQNRPVFRPTPLSALTTHTGTLPGTINTTTFESKASETRQSMWKPTGAVAEKVKGYSSNQLAGTANKPVAPVAEPIVSRNVYQQSESRNVYQQSEKQSSTFPRRKKQFSSSSFYEDEYSSFPTLEEQVQLCRQIADSLVDDSGKKSKGASMFDRRMKRSTSWIHENPEEEISPTPEQTEQNVEKKEVAKVDISQSPKSKPSLKLILDPRLPQDVAMLKTSGQQISEHNVISPDICHDLVKDLQSPVGKGGALFAKRKKKAEDWVVDEDKVKEHTKTPEPLPEPPVPPLHKLKEKFQHPKLKLVKSPWEAALQSPIGSVDSAFVDVKPTKLAETVKQAADIKVRSNSQSPVSDSGSISHPYPFTPPASGVYKPIVPRGWTGRTAPVEYDSKPSSVGFTSPEPPLMPSSPFSSAPINKPTFQNFNTTPKSWNEAKKADGSQSPGFKPVRLPAYYTK